MAADRLQAIKTLSLCSAQAATLSVCVILSTGSWRDRKWQVAALTHRGGYSCICFCSCFLAFGPLSGDTAVCTLAAEVPVKWKEEEKGNKLGLSLP